MLEFQAKRIVLMMDWHIMGHVQGNPIKKIINVRHMFANPIIHVAYDFQSDIAGSSGERKSDHRLMF